LTRDSWPRGGGGVRQVASYTAVVPAVHAVPQAAVPALLLTQKCKGQALLSLLFAQHYYYYALSKWAK